MAKRLTNQMGTHPLLQSPIAAVKHLVVLSPQTPPKRHVFMYTIHRFLHGYIVIKRVSLYFENLHIEIGKH
jgi:hypothetical protein